MDLWEALRRRTSVRSYSQEPVPADVAYYEEAFQTVYKQIYPALQAINHRSFDLQQKVTAGP